MNDEILFIILIAITVATFAAMLVQLIFSLMERKKRALQQRLTAGRSAMESAYGPIANKPQPQPEALDQIDFLRSFNHKLKRAYPDVVLARFLILVIGLAGLSFFATYVLLQSPIAGVIIAAVAVIIPFLVVNSRCMKRHRTLDDQLPEALDFLSRVMRAGHSLTTGLQMAGEEIPDPLATEFRLCHAQHSLGMPLEAALRETSERVGTPDFAFFVTAVLIQRQTGGDLAEVLTNIGSMIRARIRLQQHVKAITAEGRLVGYILLVLPIIFFFILYALNPTYARVLLVEREGMYALGLAVALQIMGLLSIRKIVSVKM
jgi:tight adherence protein B